MARKTHEKITKHFVEYNGERMSLSKFGKAIGISYKTAFRRIILNKETPEHVANNKWKPRTVIWEGNEITLGELGRRYRTSPSTIAKRIDSGWSLQEAVLGKEDAGKPFYMPKGCIWPDCFHCALDDCYAK